MKKILILLIMVVVLFGCSNEDSNPSGLKIRLSNASKFNFENITVNTSTGNVNFENISSGQNTAYKIFEKAYGYAFVELQIEGKTYRIQPFDYVGETPLKKGNYTYQITANDSHEEYGKLSLTLVKN
ncbi:hypothetical protein [Flavobacterium gyeonganense]|uniref:DUF4625 domain-containing protein n=1 Tax=Flavobacterium gyeonganense TaxID=1310418 RepID=A0ABV5H6Y8_9FLAO|nr:hypothetical protein [Flavobacterium gyeonganense]